MNAGGLIIVVEDTPHLRSTMVDILELSGYRVEEAPDGATALALIEDHVAARDPVGLIVLDMMLPGITGNGVLRQVRTRWPFIPELAMSGSDVTLDVAEAGGAQAVLPKPFELDDLLASVARCTAGVS